MKPTTRTLLPFLAVLGLYFALEAPAVAASLTVNAAHTATNAGCSFDEAITALNLGHTYDGCTKNGTGAITAINFSASTSLYFVEAADDIRSNVTLTGVSIATTNLQFTSPSGLRISSHREAATSSTPRERLQSFPKPTFQPRLKKFRSASVELNGIEPSSRTWSSPTTAFRASTERCSSKSSSGRTRTPAQW